jgi:hypothetical protein
VSSISNIGQGLFQFLNSVNSNSQSSQTSGTDPATNDGADQIAGTTGSTQGSHHGHHGGGKFKEIESAVTSALQSTSDSTTDTTDPNTIVQNAIAQVLGQNSSSTGTATISDPEGAPSATGQPDDTDGNSPGSNFIQLLQQHGIDPQQFREDFMTAFQSVNNSQNSTTPSQTIPPGSIVNTTI